ncbi:hypothetical protein POM88_035964 [Heracleum sosnowskyi]|uniref:ERCC4 domain-containing protein n=1 Tax=Heracleum sosnowskyi TaxID=360622 RepID=A0AAD8MEG0_9APIA|nr:hypothetical protein POM88_035964 [Heracleum sosnowskyi]
MLIVGSFWVNSSFIAFTSQSKGRLYHQAEMTVRYYRMHVLLIEFSQDKSFSFQSAWDISEDVTPNSLISKLSLLVLHFPRLRIVWSRSLHATAEIFASLKANQDESDEAKALRVGVPSEDGIIEDDVSCAEGLMNQHGPPVGFRGNKRSEKQS